VDFVKAPVYVVKNAIQANRLKIKNNENVVIISQTTQSMNNFLGVIDVIAQKRPKELRAFNTICKDAEERQRAARFLANSVDAMLVVGGKSSANTKRLLEVCKSILNNSYLVETEKDLRKRWFKGVRSIGITSGASTPDWIVKRVVDEVNKFNKRMR
jgi:4-hydroxy-3-methylbut-2-enyl diphosphate reductase